MQEQQKCAQKLGLDKIVLKRKFLVSKDSEKGNSQIPH
jgi:hypothetical protein